MIGLPAEFKKMFKDSKTCKLLTGLFISLIEATITCPFERIKVHFMTSSENLHYL